MRLLFAKLRHIGDALLVTPLITAVRASYPDAEITVAVRKGSEGILAGCPAIDRLLTTAPPEKTRRGLRTFCGDLMTLGKIRANRFDHAVDLTHADRGRLLVGLSGADKRCADGCVYPPKAPLRWLLNRLSTADWSHVHRAEADWKIVNDVLPLSLPPGPMVFERGRTSDCRIPCDSKTVIIHPATRWAIKEWPMDRWVELAKFLTTNGRRVIVSVGPDPDEIAIGGRIRDGAGDGVISTKGGLNWRQLAGLMHRAGYFIGVDTAAMHLAAACSLPSVALFHSSAQSKVWSPWQVPAEVLLPPGPTGEGRMEDIKLSAVVAAFGRLSGS